MSYGLERFPGKTKTGILHWPFEERRKPNLDFTPHLKDPSICGLPRRKDWLRRLATWNIFVSQFRRVA